MAQHYKNEGITRSRVNVFLGWENFNTKGNVAPGRMDQNICNRLWTRHNRNAIDLSVASPADSLVQPSRETLEALPFRKAKIGEKFGPTFTTHVFRLDITVPEQFNGHQVHLIWDSNSEAMVLSEDGTPRQGLVGGNHWARRADYALYPDHANGGRAVSGDKIRLYVEMACNGLFGAGRGGDIEPPEEDRFYTLEECSVAVFDPLAWELIHDVTLLSSLAKDLPESSPRRAQALHVANEVVNVVDVNDPKSYPAGIRLAGQFLRDCPNGASQATVYSMLHSHIDLAWLWPMAATPGKGARTFATHLRLMEKYPQCIFVQSQAQLYAWVKERYPKLWEEVCKRVHDGRFVPVGATWVEMDCNLPCGESLIRQFVHGQRFFHENFGRHCREFWLPDTFGYSAQLPQIMKGCGVDHFLTQKLSWNLFNKFPHSTFTWEGLDGTRVLAHMPPADTYNAQAFPEEVLRSSNKNKDSGVVNAAVMLVGHGDGGGGASPAMLESMRRMEDLDGVPKVKFATPDAFFEAVKEKASLLPRWVGELYFELHRGTYTSQARTKLGNRQCESLLQDLELVSGLASATGLMEGSAKVPRDLLRKSWELVLKNCFHDTLPGSSIGMVYKETDFDYRYVQDACGRELVSILQRVQDALGGASPTASRSAKRVKSANGDAVHTSDLEPGLSSGLLVLARGTGMRLLQDKPYLIQVSKSVEDVCPDAFVQPCAIETSRVRSFPSGSPPRTMPFLMALKRRPAGVGFVSNPTAVSKAEIAEAVTPACVVTCQTQDVPTFVLANGLVQAVMSATGRLKYLTMLADGKGAQDREALVVKPPKDDPHAMGGNRLIVYDDVSQFWCGWDTEVYSFEKHVEIGAATSCTVVEEGPLRVALKLVYPPTAAGSTITQYVSLRAESARLDFQTHVDWKETRKILRVLFHTQVRSQNAYFETQFGHVSRPTTFNHSWEIAKYESVGHRYADLSEPGFGVALLNDCKYGYSVRDSTMRLSLLRAPKSPDDGADLGSHEFTYAILPHWSAFPAGVVLDEAADLNTPPVACDPDLVSEGASSLPQTLHGTFELWWDEDSCGLRSAAISSVKALELSEGPGWVVVRLYEAFGARGEARLLLPEGFVAAKFDERDMLERVRKAGTAAGADGYEPVRAVGRSTSHGRYELRVPLKPFQIRTIGVRLEGLPDDRESGRRVG